MDKSFCNLWEVNLAKFVGDTYGLKQAVWLAARANYRQSLVNLEDGILQEQWHRNNQFLRLCGLGLTGIQTNPLQGQQLRELERIATTAAYQMAKELGTNPPKNVTLVKPSGTLSKSIFQGVPEGIHGIPGDYVLNNISFGENDPVLHYLKAAGFHTFENPYDATSTLVAFLQDNSSYNMRPSHKESAIDQLERYKRIMSSWAHQNVSMTVFYHKDEVKDVIKWLHGNWDSYLATAWMLKQDENASAKDIGYKYLPQEVVTKGQYEEYVARLSPIDISQIRDTTMDIQGCDSGMCPVN